jgi:hypothetical protein
MAYSSLLGARRAPAQPSGRDAGSLGPSDSSDSGSDIAGIDGVESGDPALPTDVALGADRARSATTTEGVDADTDASGTGERRSAGGDAGRDGGDIGVDRIVGDTGADEDDAELDAIMTGTTPSLGEHEDPNDEEDDEDHETPRKEEHPAAPRRRHA